jgi:hypothetical protein
MKKILVVYIVLLLLLLNQWLVMSEEIRPEFKEHENQHIVVIRDLDIL